MPNETINAIKNLIDTAEKCRNAWFWGAQGCAGMRRSTEKKYSVPEFSWEEGGHEYTASFHFQCSCAHNYAWGEYYRDGKKTTLTAIKNSYKRLASQIA